MRTSCKKPFTEIRPAISLDNKMEVNPYRGQGHGKEEVFMDRVELVKVNSLNTRKLPFHGWCRLIVSQRTNDVYDKIDEYMELKKWDELEERENEDQRHRKTGN